MAESLFELQNRFAAHLRDPEAHAAPSDVEDRRMAIYRGLFFRNISNFIAKSFPVLRKIHNDADWETLIRAFYSEYECHTPLFPEIPREFLQYLEQRQAEERDDPPWFLELAHYEWVEIALDLDQTELDSLSANTGGDLLEQIPVLSPLAWPLSYRFPVHRITPKHQPDTPPADPTHLLVYRDRQDRVHFMQLNAVSARLLHLLKVDSDQTGQDVLKRVAEELKHPDPDRVISAGADILRDLATRDVILGTRY